MKGQKIHLGLYSILLILVFSIGSITRAEIAPYHPSEGTSSTYRWNFNEFPMICAINTSHFDYNSNEAMTDVCVDNPTYAEFSVNYGMFNTFLEEAIDGILHNDSHALKFMPSYLINFSTREYVNENGEGSGGFANGYIDPENVSIGTLLMVGITQVNVTAKEKIDITGITREAWKLEYSIEGLNQTFHYDVLTGILLDAKLETYGGTIGQAACASNSNQISSIIGHEQILISTNAWESAKTPTLPAIVLVLGFCFLVITRKRKP